MATTTTTRVVTTAGQSADRLLRSPIYRIAVLGDRTSAQVVAGRLSAASEFCAARLVELPAEIPAGWSLPGFDVAIWIDAGDAKQTESTGDRKRLSECFAALGELQIGVIVLTARPDRFANVGVGFVCLPVDSGLDVLRGAILAVTQFQPALQAFAREVSGMHRLHTSLHKHFDAIDRELRLASRLQRDFMPRDLVAAGPLRFSTFFRPCTWVSGDIFDIFRLDENHYGFYLADAVGHGVAAGLLTMYIKHAIQPKRIDGNDYVIARPSEVLSALNDQLAAQGLPDSQFITGWYGIINCKTLRLEYSVAGHPPPMLIDRSGLVGELHGDGSLLGLCAGQQFTDESITLKPGQRIVVYSDGLESILIENRPPMPALPRLKENIAEQLCGGPDELRAAITEMLDTLPGGLSEADDASMVILDIVGTH
ncbi:hypothetical protein B7486_17365 [cyanobacterium TDX16]|nr:hypothetical protein B7486_17365 [cyanobacterium TDX16]